MPKNDPHGKNALYWKSVDEKALQPKTDKKDTTVRSKHLLFSDLRGVNAPEELPPLIIECSRCHERKYVTLQEYLMMHLPFSIWFPLKSHSRYLKCPSCHKQSWVKVKFTLLANELKDEN